MNWLDIIVIILLIFFAIAGLATGFIRALFSLVGLIVGVVLAGRFYVSFSPLFSFLHNDSAARIVAFIIIFLIVIIIATVLGVIVTKVVSAVLLGWLNRLLGAVFGIIMGAIFIGAILAIWVKFTGPNSALTGSAMASFLLDRFPVILSLLPAEFNTVRQFFQ